MNDVPWKDSCEALPKQPGHSTSAPHLDSRHANCQFKATEFPHFECAFQIWQNEWDFAHPTFPKRFVLPDLFTARAVAADSRG